VSGGKRGIGQQCGAPQAHSGASYKTNHCLTGTPTTALLSVLHPPNPCRSLHLVLFNNRVQRNPEAPPRPAGGAHGGLVWEGSSGLVQGLDGGQAAAAARVQHGNLPSTWNCPTQVLAGPWYFDRKGEVPPGKQPFFEIPVFK